MTSDTTGSRTLRLALLAALLAAPGCASAQQPPPTPAAERPPGVITVSASGTVQVRPDQAVLLLAVETFAKEAQAASTQNAARMQRVIQALRGLGVPQERIRTTSYALNPEYSAPPQPRPQGEPATPRITGYRAMNMVQVTLDDIDRAGAAIDTAIGAGANRVADLSYGIADATAPHEEALRRAVRAARAQASAIAEAAGVTLGRVLRVSTGEGGSVQPPRALRMAEMAATPTQPGELSVSAGVVMTFALEGGR